MNILFWVSDFPKISETFIRDQIIALINKGHKVYIFSEGGISNEISALKNFEDYDLLNKTISYNSLKPKTIKEKIVFFTKILLNKNINIYIKLLKNILLSNDLKFKSRYFYVAKFILDNKIKNIHTHFGTNAKRNIWLKKTQIPVNYIITFHGFDIRLGLINQPDFYKDVFQYADKIIAISKYNYKSLIDLGADKNKIVSLPNAVDTEFFKRKTEYFIHKPIKFITVGRLVSEKAYEILIKAISQIKDFSNFTLDIIGDGEERSKLQKLINKLNLNKIIKLRGSKTSKEVRDLMIQSDAYILSSIAEAFPTVLLEAQSCGLPIIATDVGSVKDMLIDSIIVEKGSVKKLSKAIESFINNQKEWKKMSDNSRKNVETNYSYNKIINQLEKIYK